MIQARIQKSFCAGPESQAFTLDVDFQAAAGVTVLFGPSGSGKTLTLDCIAGFITPDAGRIMLDDAILFDGDAHVNIAPRRRSCGYVFQNYALFPHMTLRANLMFPIDHLTRLERHRRVNEMLDRFHLKEVAGRRPHEVSGGEQQRCSIARALIGEPKFLLLDEPARGMDAPLRTEFYSLLRQVRTDFGTPVLMVTHDLEECFEVADEMLVIRDGALVQSGPPRKILDQPATPDVARLLGAANLFEAEISALDPGRNTSRIRVNNSELQGPYLPGHFIGDRVWITAPAHDLRALAPQGARPGPNQVPAQLLRAAPTPRGVRLEFTGNITVEMSRELFEAQRDNKDWVIEFPPHAIRVI